jgi:broad specificity phosphatase PhoE
MGDQADRSARVTATSLILVRHAAPLIAPGVPPPQWGLSPEGRADAEGLAARVAALKPVAVCASTEPKAIETGRILARPLGLALDTDPAFDEHRREDWPFEPDAAVRDARMLRVLSDFGVSVDGAEVGAAAAARFAAGVEARRARPLVIVTHGTIISLYLAWIASLEPQALWRSLKLPEALVLNGSGELVDRFG